MMWAICRNTTTVHYGTSHRCLKHQKNLDLAHLKECDLLNDCEGLEEIALHIWREN
jgi:hypothetical protein